jgi:CheY-like chemotaxis protein/HPt (histidine-containing phosphotransfer) domain-containing protein
VVRQVTVVMLRTTGAEVVAVENGQLAVEQAFEALEQGRPFDLVLMDLQMPVMDGFAATAELRRRGYSRPIVALTANAVESDHRRCLETGCDQFLIKPVGVDELKSTVKHYVARAAGCDAPPPKSVPKTADDVNVLRSLYADRPVIARLLKEFVDFLPPRLAAMETAMAAGQLDEVRRIAHQVKGSAGTFGYPTLGEAAARLEKDAREARADTSESLQRVANLCRAVIEGQKSDR